MDNIQSLMLVNVFTEIKPHNIQQVADFGVDSLVDIINSSFVTECCKLYYFAKEFSDRVSRFLNSSAELQGFSLASPGLH